MRIGIKNFYSRCLWRTSWISRFEHVSGFSTRATFEKAPSFKHSKSFSKLGATERYLSSQHDAEPTIFALSTAPGRAAIAIVRISGPACLSVWNIPTH